jgi:type VI secretion system protein ImpC
MPNFPKDRVSFNLEAESASDFHAVDEDEPFRIALLGDFTGHGERPPIADRQPILIDRDNFDEVFAELRVTVNLPTERLRIGEMDHFHPDHIYSHCSTFGEFRDMRAKLADPDTFAEAARDLLGEKPAPMPVHSDGLLDLIVGESGTAVKPARSSNDLQDFIDDAMRPHLEARQDPRASELIRKVDDIASDMMRMILNNATFKSIEAAWRTVYYLVRRLETGTELKVYLVDVTKKELEANIEQVYQMLQRSDPWAVIAGNYAFGTGDLRLLGLLGRIALKTQTSFLAEADGSLLEGDPHWEAFRQTPEAAHLGLALPRVLVRMPYGKKTVACETFDFEEITGKPDAKHMLFGSPAYFASMLIGEAFTNTGWNLRPGMVDELSDLPVYVYKDGGESKAFPCAEIELPEETVEALIDSGFMPLVSIQGSDVVRLVRFQSVSAPPRALPGRWQ